MSTPAFVLTGKPQVLEGTWFIAAAGRSQTGKHVVATCVPRSGPYAGSKDRLAIMLPPDAPIPMPGSEIDNPCVSAQVTGFDEQRNPLYAGPTVREPPADRTLPQGDDGIRVYHGCYLEGADEVRKPGDSTKLMRGAAILAPVAAAPVSDHSALPPLTAEEADLG